ncbi:expressed unknown protein [Ectocarpus siliculosus]|uniref:Uncharacterized protein n=1 Tax=Ectocarpus siliculosus TaxID=2880 RepID=D7FS11_ECTSI|nr:expressed unknown protein [Ectocarpus siliculosus]|eukprot:CBJ30952.1 expressed unknown protein [Ectocarpus siliculosus]
MVGPDAFVPSARIRPPLSTAPPRHRVEGLPLTRRTPWSLPCTHSSAQQQADNGHGSSEHHDDDDVRSTPQRRPPPAANGPASVVRFRVLRGGNPRDNAAAAAAAATPEADLVEVSLDRPDSGGGMANNPQDLREFLFLVRSSQPGSIGEDLQRRGVRVFPEEAFADAEAELGAGGGEGSAPAGAGGGEEGLSGVGWTGGRPLPLDTPMTELPRDGEGRVRLVLWDPCGPTHPLVRAVSVEPSKDASVMVLNFLLPEDSRRHDGGEGTAGEGGGCSSGYGSDFNESRSAVVFRKWFTVEQQQVIADSLASQMFAEDDDEGPGLDVDREHFPLLRDRAALAAVGDSMLSALSSDRFSGEVGGRDPPVPTRANREFNAVCYGAQAKMQEHRDTWKEWTLIVSIGNTIPFDLGVSQGRPDIRLELASGEGLLFNGYELFHEVHGVKPGTAPAFWENHALNAKGGFARVGFLSMKSFNSKGVSAPTWGVEKGT